MSDKICRDPKTNKVVPCKEEPKTPALVAKDAYGVFNPESNQWEGQANKGASGNYIKKRQLYGDAGWQYGKESDETTNQRKIYGDEYANAKKKWVAGGNKAESFGEQWREQTGNEESLGYQGHLAEVDRDQRAVDAEKEWRAGQDATYGDEAAQKSSQLGAIQNIGKNESLQRKIFSNNHGNTKQLYAKLKKGPLSLEERREFIGELETMGINPGTVFGELREKKAPTKRLKMGGEIDSPLNRNSPLKELNPYGNNYQAFSGNLQQNLDNVRQEKEDRYQQERRAMEDQRLAVQMESQQLQLAKLKEAQYESLNVPADTGIKSADQYLQDASRQMVDAQSALVNSLKAGEIDTDQFAQKSALIKAQIPALKQTKEAMSGFQSNYTELLQNGGISGADDGQASELYNLIQSGQMQIIPDENGNMIMKSPNVDELGEDGQPAWQGAEISIPLSQIGRIPQPTAKAPEMAELVKGPLAQMSDGIWNDDVANEAIDGMFSGNDQQDAKAMKAMAVDRLGMTLEEANELLNTPLEDDPNGALNALEQRVEQSVRGEMRTQFDAAELKRREQEAIVATREQQLANLKRPQNSSGGLTANQYLDESKIQQRNQRIDDIITEAVPESGPIDSGALTGLQSDRVQRVEVADATEGGFWPWSDDAQPEQIGVWVKGEKEPRLTDRANLAQLLKDINK